MRVQLIVAHARCLVLELYRQPAYIVSSLAFPALFYLIFAVPESKTVESSNYLMASFAGFAFFGVIFLQFGVGLAQERTRSWSQFLKTLPMDASGLFIARLITALLFALLAAMVVFVLAALTTEVRMPLQDWFELLFVLLAGGIVFGFMGVALGYWVSEKTSLPLGNLIYLPLSFAGGLWKPPEILPEAVKKISIYLPTRFYGNLLWNSVKGDGLDIRSIVGLILYALLFACLAYWGYVRDLNKRFRS